MRTPSKNSRCPCGSGKKYRKCCRKIEQINQKHESLIQRVIQIFREKEQKRRDFTEQYGHAKFPQGVMQGNRMISVIGGGIYKQNHDGPYNFMTAIHDHALLFFGTEFLELEESKPFSERHPAIRWMYAFVERYNRLKKDGDPEQVGSCAAWFRLAYDLFTIRDNSKLQARLKERLLSKVDFQSARYELSIAALCVTAGFDLAFEDETDNLRTHPEFIATDKFSSEKIAVEVKSRRRRGAHGFEGGKDMRPGTRVDIRSLVTDAYQKETDLPFYVFIDVNLPVPQNEENYNEWLSEIGQAMEHLRAEGYENPCSANVIFFTNDPSHYLINDAIGNSTDFLWIAHHIAIQPRIPHPKNEIWARFMKAHRQRAAPPESFPDF